MTELEGKALLGDRDAQKECTKKGIMLPCPCCGGKAVYQPEPIDGGDHFFRANIYCTCCHLEIYNCIEHTRAEDCMREFPNTLVSWNRRPAPPIGRCDDCNHRYENENNEYECEIHNICPDDNFYCKDFEPKESEENERTEID